MKKYLLLVLFVSFAVFLPHVIILMIKRKPHIRDGVYPLSRLRQATPLMWLQLKALRITVKFCFKAVVRDSSNNVRSTGAIIWMVKGSDGKNYNNKLTPTISSEDYSRVQVDFNFVMAGDVITVYADFAGISTSKKITFE